MKGRFGSGQLEGRLWFQRISDAMAWIARRGCDNDTDGVIK
jgi:hypothetical protein